jgi:hypothetical protein
MANEAGSPGKWRLLAAFAVLPVADALIAFFAFPAVWRLSGEFQLADSFQAARTVAVVAGVLGLLVTLSGGVPVVFWLMKRGPVSFEQILIAGVALGNAPFVVFVLALIPFAILHLTEGTMSQHLSPLSELLAGTVRAIGMGSVMGMASAVVFWFLGIRDTDIAR